MYEVRITLTLADIIMSMAIIIVMFIVIRSMFRTYIEGVLFDEYASLNRLLDVMRRHAHDHKDLSGFRYISDVSKWSRNHFNRSYGAHRRAPWLLRKLRRLIIGPWESPHPHVD